MDSKTVNKLIRSEIWPLLRSQGFSSFETRKAFRFRGPFIDVVSFRSFNSYEADVIGCTTFSFGVNLDVYVNRLAQAEWSFHKSLNKRSPIDGFDRADIFYLDHGGNTTGPVFREVRHLLEGPAGRWFDAHNDIDWLIAAMQREESAPDDIPLGFIAGRGSYAWHEVLATLMLMQHAEAPSPQTAAAALQEIDLMIGEVLDFPIALASPDYFEKQVLKVRELWESLGSFVGSSRVDLQACKLEYSIVSPK